MEKAQGGLTDVYQYPKEACKEDGGRLFPVVPNAGPEAMGATEMQEVPSACGSRFSCEGDRALAWVTQRGCGVSIHGVIPKPTGHGPGSALAGVG